MTMTIDGPRLRASDAERAATVQAVQDAMARGQLTHEEGDERMAAAFAARYRDELPALTADLAPAAVATLALPAGWRALWSALVIQVRAEVAATAAAGFRSRRFLVVALVVLALLGGLVLLAGLAGHGPGDGGHERLLPGGRG